MKLPSEIRRADKLLLKYQTQSIETAEEIEDLIFALELAGTPYQAAHILEYEMNAGRMARSLENYLRLSDLYQYAREDGHALSVLAAGLERFTRDNPLYGKLLESHDSLRKNIEANDPEVIRAEFRKRSHGVISEWSLERELCFVKIKQAYDDEDFIGQFNLKDEACQKYKAEYDQKYRMAYTPMQKD